MESFCIGFSAKSDFFLLFVAFGGGLELLACCDSSCLRAGSVDFRKDGMFSKTPLNLRDSGVFFLVELLATEFRLDCWWDSSVVKSLGGEGLCKWTVEVTNEMLSSLKFSTVSPEVSSTAGLFLDQVFFMLNGFLILHVMGCKGIMANINHLGFFSHSSRLKEKDALRFISAFFPRKPWNKTTCA